MNYATSPTQLDMTITRKKGRKKTYTKITNTYLYRYNYNKLDYIHL